MCLGVVCTVELPFFLAYFSWTSVSCYGCEKKKRTDTKQQSCVKQFFHLLSPPLIREQFTLCTTVGKGRRGWVEENGEWNVMLNVKCWMLNGNPWSWEGDAEFYLEKNIALINLSVIKEGKNLASINLTVTHRLPHSTFNTQHST